MVEVKVIIPNFKDKENRQLRDKLIGELKSRMQKGEL